MITLKQKTILIEKVAIIPIIVEVVSIIWLFLEYILRLNSIGFSAQSFPVLIWWITPILLIDVLNGIRLRLFGLSIKVIFVIVYWLSLFPDWLDTTVPAPFIFAVLISSVFWMYIERDAFSESVDSPFEPVANNYIFGKWFSKNSPFAPLERGGYFYQKQEPHIEEILQLSFKVKNECFIYSDRVNTIREYIILGVLVTFAWVSFFLINPESKNQVKIYSLIGGTVILTLLISAKVVLFKDIDQQVSLIQSSLCDCLESSMALNTLVSKKADLSENHDSLTMAVWGETITTQINILVDALSLFGKDLEKFNLISLQSTSKVRSLTQVSTLNKILSEDLLEKTQVTRIYTKEMIWKYKKALQLYTKELSTDESAAGEIATIRLWEIIRSFEAIHIEPMSRMQS